MNGNLIRASTLAGRFLLALIFLVSGGGKLMDIPGTTAYMATMGLPMPSVLLWGSLAFELIGALLVLVGYKARLGAFLLILFMIPTTLVFHSFWGLAGNERIAQMLQFLKNGAIIGGLFLVVAYGAGPLSLEAYRRSR